MSELDGMDGKKKPRPPGGEGDPNVEQKDSEFLQMLEVLKPRGQDDDDDLPPLDKTTTLGK